MPERRDLAATRPSEDDTDLPGALCLVGSKQDGGKYGRRREGDDVPLRGMVYDLPESCRARPRQLPELSPGRIPSTTDHGAARRPPGVVGAPSAARLCKPKATGGGVITTAIRGQMPRY